MGLEVEVKMTLECRRILSFIGAASGFWRTAAWMLEDDTWRLVLIFKMGESGRAGGDAER